MPELPDLQVFSKNLTSRIVNKRVTAVEVFNQNKVNQNANIVKSAVSGTKITDIVRRGKELFFELDNNNVFSVHLMLSGKFDICEASDIEKIRFKILSLSFEDGQALVISDYQSMCRVNFNPRISNVPDAMGEDFTLEYLRGAVKNSRKNIKALLIDQNIIKGIGNAYVDEILWKANISPESIAGKIPEGKVQELYEAVLFVLADAIENIEKITPDIISGEERSFLKVHNPRKKVTDAGDKILVKIIAAKKTYYTDKQQLYK